MAWKRFNGKEVLLTVVVAEISVVPLGTGSCSLSEHVARAVSVLERAGATYQLTPMGTVVEGELDQVLRWALDMHRAVLTGPVQRVSTTIKIDERLDKPISIQGKVRAVTERLGGE